MQAFQLARWIDWLKYLDDSVRYTAPVGALLDQYFSVVSTDTRTLDQDAIFVPLVGERFDGHDFIPSALQKSGVVVLCQHDHQLSLRQALQQAGLSDVLVDYPIIFVANTYVSFKALAGGYRKALACPVIAISGSVGKTSTRDMIGSALAQCRVAKTVANLNNSIGVSQTILATPEDAQFLILEMGIDGPNQMAELTEIVQPDYAVLTGVGHSHIENFPDRQALISEKAGIFSHYPHPKLLVLNARDQATSELAFQAMSLGIKVILVAVFEASDIAASRALRNQFRQDLSKWKQLDAKRDANCFGGFWMGFIRSSDFYQTEASLSIYSLDSCEAPSKTTSVYLPFGGVHHLVNALFGLVFASEFHLDMDRAIQDLKGYRPTGSRQKIEKIGKIILIDDAYNASLESMLSGLSLVKMGQQAGHRTLVCLAGIKELGQYEDHLYPILASAILANPPDYLLLLGEFGETIRTLLHCQANTAGREIADCKNRIRVFRDRQSLTEAVLSLAQPNDVIYVKGSNAYGMQQVAQAVRDFYTTLCE